MADGEICIFCNGSGEVLALDNPDDPDSTTSFRDCSSCGPYRDRGNPAKNTIQAMEDAVRAVENAADNRISRATIENNATTILFKVRLVWEGSLTRADFWSELDEMRQAEERYAKRYGRAIG